MIPGDLPLAKVVDNCRAETEKFRRGGEHDDSFCFELIRRAVCDRCEAAWDAFLSQYRIMVLAWVKRHPSSGLVGEDDDYWVNRTFERFWRAVGRDRFGQFPSLAALLGYLKMCAHSVLLDDLRSRAGDPAQDDPPTDTTTHDSPEQVEALALENQRRHELWRAVNAECDGEEERVIVYLSFVLDYKPREICARYPERFADVGEIYRVKRNLLDRLRRSTVMAEFLG